MIKLFAASSVTEVVNAVDAWQAKEAAITVEDVTIETYVVATTSTVVAKVFYHAKTN